MAPCVKFAVISAPRSKANDVPPITTKPPLQFLTGALDGCVFDPVAEAIFHHEFTE